MSTKKKKIKEEKAKKRKAEAEAKRSKPSKILCKRGSKRRKERELKNSYRFGDKYKVTNEIDFPQRNAYLKQHNKSNPIVSSTAM